MPLPLTLITQKCKEVPGFSLAAALALQAAAYSAHTIPVYHFLLFEICDINQTPGSDEAEGT